MGGCFLEAPPLGFQACAHTRNTANPIQGPQLCQRLPRCPLPPCSRWAATATLTCRGATWWTSHQGDLWFLHQQMLTLGGPTFLSKTLRVPAPTGSPSQEPRSALLPHVLPRRGGSLSLHWGPSHGAQGSPSSLVLSMGPEAAVGGLLSMALVLGPSRA